MNRQSDPPMDREAQALNDYMDWIADHPGTPPPPPADEIQAFAAAIQQSVPQLTAEDLANDPILASLKASQRQWVEEQARAALAQPAEKRKRTTTVETERAEQRVGAAQTGTTVTGSAGGGAATRRMPAFSYMTAIVLLGLVTITLFAITISSRDGFRGMGGVGSNPDPTAITGGVGISSQEPSVVVDGVEMQIRDWDVRQEVGNGDAREEPFRGAFVVLEMVVVKSEGEPGPVPFYPLLIKDAQGNLFSIDIPATEADQAVNGGLSIANGDVIGSDPRIILLVFDVPVSETYQLTNIEEAFTLPLSEP